MKKINLSLVSLSLLLGACSAPKPEIIALNPALKPHINSTDVHLKQGQEKLEADIEASNISHRTGGGLLFALVDAAIMSHRSSQAEDAIAELQTHFKEFNADQKVKNSLQLSLDSADWMHAGKVHVDASFEAEQLDAMIKNCKSDDLLISRMDYRFNPNLSVLTGTLYLEMLPTGQKLKTLTKTENPLENPVFRVKVKATEALATCSKDKEENAKSWNQNNGQLIKTALDKVTKQVFANLDQALRNPDFIS